MIYQKVHIMRLLALSSLLAMTFISFVYAVDSNVEKALLDGKWEEVFNALETSSKDYVDSMLLYHASLSTNHEISFALDDEGKDIEKWIKWTGRICKKHSKNPIAIYLKASAYYRKGMGILSKADRGPIFHTDKGVVMKGGLEAFDEFDEALKLLQKAISKDSKLAEAYNMQGLIYLEKNDLHEALLNFNKAIKYKPDFANAYSNRSRIHYRNRDYDMVLEDLDSVIQLNPQSVRAYISRADIYSAINFYDEAVNDLSMAAKLRPDDKYIYFDLGVAHDCNGDYDLAINAFGRALELDSNYTEAYSSRGIPYANKGQFEKAIEQYDKALQLDSTFCYPYYNKAIACESLFQHQTAIENYEKFIEYANPSRFRKSIESVKSKINRLKKQ